MENWRAIPGYEGFYEVSDLGNVRSLMRVDCAGRTRFPRPLKGGRNLNGYRFVSLYRDRIGKTFKVCRLVLMSFVGPCPSGMEAAHNDGVSENDSLSNLRWDTHKGNCADKKRHGTSFTAHGVLNFWAKLTDSSVREIRQKHTSGVPQKDLATEYGVNRSTMSMLINRKTWVHVP